MAFHDDYFFTTEEKYMYQEDVFSTRMYRSNWDRSYTQIGLDDNVVNPCIYYLEFRGNEPMGDIFLNFEHQAFFHVESGRVRMRGGYDNKDISQPATQPDFVEPLSFNELYSNIQSNSWAIWDVSHTSTTFGGQIGNFFMSRYSII